MFNFFRSLLFVATLSSLCAVANAQHAHHSNSQPQSSATQPLGILLLAHGGKQNWNEEVYKIAATVNQTIPTEVAFGMASRHTLQEGVDRLVARQVKQIVAVPLFVSSHSSVITATQYLLRQRSDAPAELKLYAKMDHSHDAHHGPAASSPTASADPTTPVNSPVPIRMVGALDGHPLVADILLARAAGISQAPAREVVIIVAHGPNQDKENRQWLAEMKTLAERMKPRSNYKRIEYLTVRDDAPEPIRSQAKAELRALVTRATDEGARALIVPLLISFGGIEEGVKKRLEGLEYTICRQGLLPDERLAEWVQLAARQSQRTGNTAQR
jgi:sirohydrochlorin ferrochelatase